MPDQTDNATENFRRILDLPYRSGVSEKCKLDLFLPSAPNGAAVFFVHGGGWQGGSRRQWHPVMKHFSMRGYVCASAGYRLLDETVFPGIFEDVRTAFAFFKSRSEAYGFQPHRIASFGSSAGGHLASLLATVSPDEELGMTTEAPLRDTRPAATIALCTVFSCHSVGGFHRPALFGGVAETEHPRLYASASPIDRICGREGPFAMVVGDADTTTPVASQQAMCDQLLSHGVPCALHILPGVDHGFGYGAETDAQRKMLKITDEFLTETLA